MTTSDNDQGWETREDYFVQKRRKLITQQSMMDVKTSLFSGMSFYIDGYTNPSFQELKKMIVSNGGIVEHYYYDTLKIDVVIAQNLAQARADHFKKMRYPPQILKPNYVLDCTEQKKLLPKSQYVVGEMRPPNQSFLSFPATSSRTQNSVTSSNLVFPPPPPSVPQRNYSHRPQQTNNNRRRRPRFNAPPSISNFQRPAPPQPPPQQMNIPNDPTQQQRKVVRPSVKNYFQKSRLHFLSSTKHLLKRKYNRRSKTNHEVNISQYLSVTRFTEKRRIIVHIDIDCFFASVAMKKRPDLHEKPVGVTSTTNIMLLRKSNKSTSDIASCNYVARKYGIRNGMWVKTAQRLCPNLILVPYDFEGYRKASEGFYDILSSYKKEIPNISVMSVDEALLDMTFSPPPPNFAFSSSSSSSSSSGTTTTTTTTTPYTQASLNIHDTNQSQNNRLITFGEVLRFLKVVKKRIWDELGIQVSCGIGDSILTARLACLKAKPNGICILKEEDVDDLLHHADQQEKKLRIRDFPGIGWSNERKLIQELKKKKNRRRRRRKKKMMMIDEDDDEEEFEEEFEEEEEEEKFYAVDLLEFSEDDLKNILGVVKGRQVFQFLRGVDDREISYEKKRKSISVDLNYGLRLENDQMIEFWEYLDEICEELSNRMKQEKIKGKKLTLKILKRRHTKKTSKYLGTGWCDSFTRTKKFDVFVDSQVSMFRESKIMFSELKFRLEELRGIGLTMKELKYDKSIDFDEEEEEEEIRRRRSPGKKQMRTITITQMMRSPKKDYSSNYNSNIIKNLLSSSSSSKIRNNNNNNNNRNQKKKKKTKKLKKKRKRRRRRKRKRSSTNDDTDSTQSKLKFFSTEIHDDDDDDDIDDDLDDDNNRRKKRKLMMNTHPHPYPHPQHQPNKNYSLEEMKSKIESIIMNNNNNITELFSSSSSSGGGGGGQQNNNNIEKTGESLLLILEEYVERKDVMSLSILTKYIRRICGGGGGGGRINDENNNNNNMKRLYDIVIKNVQSSFKRVFGKSSTLVL